VRDNHLTHLGQSMISVWKDFTIQLPKSWIIQQPSLFPLSLFLPHPLCLLTLR
jgi:hypothetical protein